MTFYTVAILCSKRFSIFFKHLSNIIPYSFYTFQFWKKMTKNRKCYHKMTKIYILFRDPLFSSFHTQRNMLRSHISKPHILYVCYILYEIHKYEYHMYSTWMSAIFYYLCHIYNMEAT